DHPLLQWRADIQGYLNGLMCLEGRGDCTTSVCGRCSTTLSSVHSLGYRCKDCDDCSLYCKECIVTQHAQHPLHRIKEWTGTHYEHVSLKALGLRVQLGHPPGERCVNPVRAFGDAFVVLDLNGVHEVGLDFCRCERAAASTSQLLRYRWFPATSTDPRTAATFRLLQTFHLLSGQSKVSAFEFYTTLARKSNNTGTKPLKDHYVSFLQMIRQWRHLKLLKHAGRGNVPGGAVNVPPGSCAVECPACPHPGKNLPSDWESAPPETRYVWKYKLYLAINANFRLKRKKVSSDTLDPSLNAGSAYFVERSAYKTHLETFDKDDTKERGAGDCNTHDAVKLANIKGTPGLAVTGVATVDCSRHEMKRPCSVGNLQKGERQVNTDYLLNSSLSHNAPTQVSVSYDIACSYSVRVVTRWTKYGYDTFSNRVIMWSIPMFHLNAHRERCRSVFSPYLLPHSGRLNGEGVERRWAMANGYAPSTKEMGPGSCSDLLDDVFGDQNWAKVTRLHICSLLEHPTAATMLTRIKVAVVERGKHVKAFKQLTSSLPPLTVAGWEEMTVAWDAAPTSATNPYEYKRSHISQAAIRVILAEQDALDIREGRTPTLHEYYSSSTMIVIGIGIEDQQHKLRADSAALSASPTDLQRAKILERQNALQRRVDGWRGVQQLFIPSVATLVAQPRADDSILPQDHPLFLPSTACTWVTIPQLLLEHEWRLREAQAYDALTDLRGHLEVRAYLYRYKDEQVRGQKEITRSHDVIHGIDSKIKLNTSRYRAAYTALTTLSAALSKIDWRGSLQPLNDGDIWHIAAGDGSGSEGRREISWIWKASGVDSEGNLVDEQASGNLQEGLCVEWCKARARAMQWTEEVEILDEEMRRVKQYHVWLAGWWETQAASAQAERADFLEGQTAYAHRQVSIRRKMGEYCCSAWSCVTAWICLGQSVEDQIPDDLHSQSDSDLPSLHTVTASTTSTTSLGAILNDDEIQEAGDVELAMEDLD
ncbi:hypothetical protein C8T65DRAFT_588017, partial [Cerioporus squamosus]